jgi:hypothetical protein
LLLCAYFFPELVFSVITLYQLVVIKFNTAAIHNPQVRFETESHMCITHGCLQNGGILGEIWGIQTYGNPTVRSQGCMVDVLRSEGLTAGVFQKCWKQHGDGHYHTTTQCPLKVISSVFTPKSRPHLLTQLLALTCTVFSFS